MTAVAAVPIRVHRTRPSQPIPLTRVTAVELRKMFDTRAGFWLMASIVITALLATGGVIAVRPGRRSHLLHVRRPRSGSR